MERAELPAKLQRARRDELVVEAADGEPIGRVDSLYYDLESGRPAWIGVRSEHEPDLRTLVPVEGASASGEVVRVPFSRALVESAPRVDAEEVDGDTERRLADHFGLAKPADEQETAVLTPIVRHEEAFVVSKERAEIGRVRLRKWVETEPVTVEVALQRELIRIVKEPIGRPAPPGVELGDAEIAVPVFAERPALEKRVVAVERIRLEKGIRLENVKVEDELRVERVATEGASEK